MSCVRVLAASAALTALLALAVAAAPGAGPGFGRVAVARGFNSPLLLTYAPGDAKALYIVEQPGRILRLVRGHRRVFLDIRSQVDFGGERGLLGLAFSPHYQRDHLFYVAYTTKTQNVVARYQARSGRADPTSAKLLLSVPDPYSNHNGGNLAFGPDGLLYTSIGDGGSAGDPENRAQDPNSLFGKLLTLDVSKSDAHWTMAALGLRNPWRFSFDRATGDLYIGDVGQNEVEEIDYTLRSSPGLVNYGWNLYEGSRRFNSDTQQGPGTLVFPAFEYTHEGGNCTVIGGYVYRGKERPSLGGRYIFGDYCSGAIWSLRISGGKAQGVRRERFRIPGLTSFGQDAAGELYAVDGDGVIYKLT